ncbi:Eco57I restriction-modification methylase domain-containing protein [Micromonospora sp. NPDC005324]|uniref:Eco57I restriction-modification methylase domain-containing protein n=1 Tax=Micromonospora sp. NPDC005324 TaxID=3157033 RepID=UPI0033AC3DB6
MPTRASLHHVDYLDWLSTTWPEAPGPRLIWGNPPYTRHQGLPAETKTRARQASRELAPGGRSGLSTYFLAASLANLKPQDSLCLLLPSNWLEAEYARSVREHLWQATSRLTELHIFPHSLRLFPVASVAAMVVWVGPQTEREQPLVVHRLDGDLATGFASVRTESHPRIGVAPANFMSFKKAKAPERRSEDYVQLASLARIRRGVATGANHFFLLTDAQVEGLPAGTYVPAATRLREMPGDTLDKEAHDALGAKGERRWLLWLAAGDINDPVVNQLIDRGKFERVHEAHLCEVRTPWYAVERIPVPDLLFGPMTKGRFRLIRNEVGAIPTNTFYGITLRRRAVAVDSVESLLSWIRSPSGQSALVEVARQHGSGTLKIEPRDLAQLRIPAKIARSLDRG